MKRKTIAGLIAIGAIIVAVIFAGCIEEKGESEGKVKGAPLSVKIEKVVYPEGGVWGVKVLDVKIYITNTGNKDVDLNQFDHLIYKYDPSLKAYQEYFHPLRGLWNVPTLGPGGTYEIPASEDKIMYNYRPETEEKYKFVMEKIPETGSEEFKKVLEVEFSVTPEDWDNPDLYRYE